MTCINWTGAMDGRGYGVRRINKKVVKAHRAALAEAEGIDIPPPSVKCLHSCDNPVCVNPDHLRWGTQFDNVQDAVKRGRLQEANDCATRINQNRHELGRVIAAEYGITEGTVPKEWLKMMYALIVPFLLTWVQPRLHC